MSVQLLAENILEETDFLSATEQEGPYWKQPSPDSGNGGNLRLLSSGDPQNDSHDLTSTGAGSTTTVICSDLDIFGDDYFIGGKVEITEVGHGAEGEIRTISDFARSTGTITVSSAFGASIGSGVNFTLRMKYASRDFRVELVAGGDPGTSTMKWSHDGGATYLGRNDPDQANWLGEDEIDGTITFTGYPKIAELANGDWLCLYMVSQLYCKKSSDKGLTWGSPIQVGTYSSDYPMGLIVLPTGRVVAYSIWGIRYSDDNGDTWVDLKSRVDAGYGAYSVGDVILMSTGRVYMVASQGVGSDVVTGLYSDDGGLTFANSVSIASTTNGQQVGAITEAANGDLVCVYASDEESINNYEIKCKISSDGGVIWGSTIDVIDYVSNGFTKPSITRDMDGTLFCSAAEATTDARIVYCVSTDNGATWGSTSVLKSVSSVDLHLNSLELLDGHIMVCVYTDQTNADLDMVRRGMWEAYSANGCPTAIAADKMGLVCDARLVWQGSQGVAGDKWNFEAGYYFGMQNLISHSPSKPWRSEQDGIDCGIVIDMGSYRRFYADMVAFFGCNIFNLRFQMNASDSWGSPSVDEEVRFNIGEDQEVEDETGASWGIQYHGLSLADGQAFFKAEGIDLGTLFGGSGRHRIEMHDSAGKTIKGYIDIADAAEVLGSELITDGTFDNWTGDDPDDWLEGINCDASEDTGRIGGSSAKITNSHTSASGLRQAFSVTAGKLYKVVGWAKATAGDKYRFLIYDQSNTQTIYSQPDQTDTSWTQTIIYFTAPSGCSVARVYLECINNGDICWVDDVSVKEVTDVGTDGVHVVDSLGGATRNWVSIDSGFEYNDSSYTFEVYEMSGMGEVDAVEGNYIKDSALMTGYKDHELKGDYIRFLTGADAGKVWKIEDNVGDYIVLDTEATHNVAADDDFIIFQGSAAVMFTEDVERYIRVLIGAQETVEDYYQVGAMITGSVGTLPLGFKVGYGKTHVYDIVMHRTPHGGLIPVKGADRKRRFNLEWDPSENTLRQVVSVLDYIEGKNIVLIPDSTDLKDVYLVKHIQEEARQRHVSLDNFILGPIELEEVL